MYDFENKTLLLTGANGGIGRAVAQLFYAHGANLVLADLDHAGLETFAHELGGDVARRVAVLRMDAANPDDAQAAVDTAQARFGGVDYLVPSAGLYLAQPVQEMTDAQWRQTIAINLDGVFYLTRRTIPHLRDGSAIVNLTSMAGHRGAFYNAHYSASKGGLMSFTRSLARELGPKTRVNAVSPGVIATPMTNDLIARRGQESVEQTPLKRLGHPGEIASVIGFLCSSAASFITGEVIHVNGGLYIAG
jgi:3-oxoacyl-[acyl-carrier protein] reductase